MKKPSHELSVERGRRVKLLIEDWNNEHPDKRITHKQVAEWLYMQPSVFSAKLSGSRTLTEQDAAAIAKIFPGTLVDYILGNVEHPLLAQNFFASLRKEKERDELLFAGLSGLASISGYQVSPPPPIEIDEETFSPVSNAIPGKYTIEKNGKTIALSSKQMEALEKTICSIVDAQLKLLFQLDGGENNG